MAELPVTGLEELELHLQHLIQAPDTPLNASLFDEVELQLTGKLSFVARLSFAPTRWPSEDDRALAQLSNCLYLAWKIHALFVCSSIPRRTDTCIS